MQFQLSGQHVKITPGLRSHVQAKLTRLSRLDDRLLGVTVVLSLDKLQQCAEATLDTSGVTLHAEAAATDMYAAIDTMFDKLVAQLRRHREKIHDKHLKAARQDHHGN